MSKNINSILKKVLDEINPDENNIKNIEEFLKEFIGSLNKEIKKRKLNIEIFIGGSFAKKTAIKREIYDIDVYLRFSKTYRSEEISEISKKLLKKHPGFEVIHGSRDYFKISGGDFFYVEIIPVIKITKSKEAKNVTDLSYSHVNYIKRKIKNKKIFNEIKIAKAFCWANNFYGAESYIKGLSGYAIELLVYHYGSFLKFIKAIAKHNPKNKLIIDTAKHYKNKNQIMLDINSSKLQSPIILIDPTYKQRNAAAALSMETFRKFQNLCKSFLKKPGIEFFEQKKTNLDKIKKDAEKNKFQFILLEAKTNKQKGDIAGSKLLKFYNFIGNEISKSFYIKNKGFNYNKNKDARYFFVVSPKDEILVTGPRVKDKKHVKAFERKYKIYFTKKGRIYTKLKTEQSINKFMGNWKSKNKKQIKEMYIEKLRILGG